MESKTLLDREELAMDVKEAAKRAAAYTADIETVMDPKSLSEFLSKSGFARSESASLGSSIAEGSMASLRCRRFGIVCLSKEPERTKR